MTNDKTVDSRRAVPVCAAVALNEMGTLHRVRGDLRRAGIYHQQALDLSREIGSTWMRPAFWPACAAAPWPPVTRPTHRRPIIKSDELASADPAQVIRLLRPCMLSLAACPDHSETP